MTGSIRFRPPQIRHGGNRSRTMKPSFVYPFLLRTDSNCCVRPFLCLLNCPRHSIAPGGHEHREGTFSLKSGTASRAVTMLRARRSNALASLQEKRPMTMAGTEEGSQGHPMPWNNKEEPDVVPAEKSAEAAPVLIPTLPDAQPAPLQYQEESQGHPMPWHYQEEPDVKGGA
jgi:hypothetical protein